MQKRFKRTDDIGCNGAADPTGKEPRETEFDIVKSGLHKYLSILTNTRHLQKVFRRLFANHVHNIIHGDNTKKCSIFFNHWNGQQVVFGDQLCHFLLIRIGSHMDNISLHKTLQFSTGGCCYKIAE